MKGRETAEGKEAAAGRETAEGRETVEGREMAGVDEGDEIREAKQARKRKHVDSGNENGDADQGPGPITLSQQSDSWLSNVLLKIAPGNSQSSIDADAREIDEDLRKAACRYPFLGV